MNLEAALQTFIVESRELLQSMEDSLLLLEREPTGTWRALVRPGRRVRPGTTVTAGDLTIEVGDIDREYHPQGVHAETLREHQHAADD